MIVNFILHCYISIFFAKIKNFIAFEQYVHDYARDNDGPFFVPEGNVCESNFLILVYRWHQFSVVIENILKHKTLFCEDTKFIIIV